MSTILPLHAVWWQSQCSVTCPYIFSSNERHLSGNFHYSLFIHLASHLWNIYWIPSLCQVLLNKLVIPRWIRHDEALISVSIAFTSNSLLSVWQDWKTLSETICSFIQHMLLDTMSKVQYNLLHLPRPRSVPIVLDTHTSTFTDVCLPSYSQLQKF